MEELVFKGANDQVLTNSLLVAESLKITSIHETDKMSSLQIVEILCISKNSSIFVVLQFFILFARGIFYIRKVTILKYRQVVSILYFAHGIIKNCSKLDASCLSYFII